jgi:hypothetical protein
MSLSSHSQFLWDKPQAVDLRVEEWCGDWGVRIEDFGKTPGTRVINGAYSPSDDAAQLRCQNALDTAVLVRVQVDSRCTASVKSRGANHLVPYVNANVHARPPFIPSGRLRALSLGLFGKLDTQDEMAETDCEDELAGCLNVM